jgi:Txe/YoeB family toxin of Txe-Axe toxin-antitoxin module
MKLLLSLFIAVAPAIAQQAAAGSEPKKDPPADAAAAKLRTDVLKILEMDGTRQSLRERLTAMIPAGKAKMKESCEKCAPEFSEEWARRMEARFNLDDVLEIYVRAYVKYLNKEDVQRMFTLLEAVKKDPQNVVVPPELKTKLASVLPSLQSEILGGTTQYGAKLGAEIGMEIEKEHPEYTKAMYQKDKP